VVRVVVVVVVRCKALMEMVVVRVVEMKKKLRR